MPNKGLNKIFNFFIGVFAILNVYFSVIPHFTSSTMDVDHKLMTAIILIFFLIVVIYSKKITKASLIVFFLASISFIFVYINGKNDFVYYTKWIFFASSIVLYYLVLTYKYELNDKTLKIVYFSCFLPILFYTIEAMSSKYYTYTNSGNRLILTFDNQNAAAMQLLIISCVMFLFAKKFIDEKKYFFVFISFLQIAICTVLIVLTGARSSLLGIAFILGLFIFDKLQIILNKKTIIIPILIPLIFSGIFVMLSLKGYSEIRILGRNIFNGREKMWLEVFSQPLNNKIFGAYHVFTINDGKLPFQLHNGIVDMIASYGVIVTSVYMIMIYKVLCSFLNTKTKMGAILTVCILSLLIQSTGEAALFIGNRSNFICMILIFSQYIDLKRENNLQAEKS